MKAALKADETPVTDPKAELERELAEYKEAVLILKGDMEALAEDLEGALLKFEGNKTDGSISAVCAALRYFSAIGIPARLQRPLVEMAIHHADLTKADARKPLGESLKLAVGAAAIDVLNVAIMVANAMGVPKTAKQLIAYRKNLRKGRGRKEAKAQYESALGHLKPFRALPVEQRQEKILQLIREMTKG